MYFHARIGPHEIIVMRQINKKSTNDIYDKLIRFFKNNKHIR